MSFKDEFNGAVREGFEVRVEADETNPGIEVWPEEDDFGRWVASHSDRLRTVVCETAEFKDAPFCGRGYH